MTFKKEVGIKLDGHLERLKLLESQSKELLEAVNAVPNVKESARETFGKVIQDYYFLWNCPDSQTTKQERKHKLHKIIDEIKERFSKIENRLDEIEGSLSQFDHTKWRITMLEEKKKDPDPGQIRGWLQDILKDPYMREWVKTGFKSRKADDEK